MFYKKIILLRKDGAFDYIPDESNDSVIYMKEPVPIEIGVKPVKKELLFIEE